MVNLKKLYPDVELAGDNPGCSGCSILKQSKPFHSHMDYEGMTEAPVLFISDSMKIQLGQKIPFATIENTTLRGFIPFPLEECRFTASVKCPSVKESDMTPADMKICRLHLDETIKKVKPRLVFTCGNLAMKMLLKKSGIASKRGKEFEYTTFDESFSCTVVPLYNLWSVSQEPKLHKMFKADLINSYEKFVLNKTNYSPLDYQVIYTEEKLGYLTKFLENYEGILAVDIETTGLDFLQDRIQTISLTCKEGTFVVPWLHKDSPFNEGDAYDTLISSMKRILENPKSRKIFHNVKFDYKFLYGEGIETANIWDTKLTHHVLDEDMPSGLMDLVKFYFPKELEKF
jgi:uracil-DNA glycosylase family 4